MRPFFAALMLFMAVLPLRAQFFERLFNPDVKVTLLHPPGLGLKVKRVAFVPPRDADSSELVALLAGDLAASGQVDVVDRANFQQVLREQQLGEQGYLEPATVARLGKLLGPSVLLVLEVHRCKASFLPLQVKRDIKDKEGKVIDHETTYTSKTRLDFSATVQAVDLETGRIFTVRRLAFEPSLQTESKKGKPEFPPESALRELAFSQARSAVRQMLLPWSEERKLIFYDDKAFGMKEAYRLLEARNVMGALERSREALNQARQDPKAEPKHLGRTQYNVGMCQFILGRHDEALPFLRGARETDPENGIYRDALEECQRAISLREEMQRVDDRSQAANPVPRLPEDSPLPRVEAPKPAPDAKVGPEERLERLDRLHKKGLITDSEYKKRREEILKEL